MLLKDTYSIKLLCDNQSNINLVNNPIFHYRTKHVKIQYHFIKKRKWMKISLTFNIHTHESIEC